MSQSHGTVCNDKASKKCAFCFLTDKADGAGPAANTPAARGCRHSFAVDKRHVIFSQGDPGDGFYYLISGLVALSLMDAKGNALSVRLVGSGETFGYRSFFAGDDHSVTATILTEARYCHIEHLAAKKLFTSDRSSQLLFMRRVAQGLRRANEARLRSLSMTVRARLVHFLLSLADSARGSEGGPLTITLPMSRGDLARQVETIPATLSRTLNKLQTDGVLECRREKFIFPNPDMARMEIEDWLDHCGEPDDELCW